jgi:hypothetical protein
MAHLPSRKLTGGREPGGLAGSLPEAYSMAIDDDDKKKIRRDFADAVNMSSAKLQTWLDTDESREVGQKKAGGESVGHASGRRIIRLLGKKDADLTDGDYAHMRKVAGYVARHSAQRPSGDVTDTPWRWSLMNWGNDPLGK